jgi:SAM-dependent methyltransferase
VDSDIEEDTDTRGQPRCYGPPRRGAREAGGPSENIAGEAAAVVKGRLVVPLSFARRDAPAAAPVPESCYLCGSARIGLRFPARGEEVVDHRAYSCTSFGHRRHPPIWACGECGLLFQSPRPSEAELLASYGGVEDPIYLEEKANRYQTFRRAVRLLGPPDGRRLLDVGAYCGFFVDVAREAGFEAEGLELSRWAAAQARTLGLAVRNETIEERARSGSRYDVVTMWDVLEHLAEPRRDLEHSRRLLRPRGRLVLSTIDARSLVARLLGSRWPWLMDMHLFYFDRRNLPALLEEVGFRVLERRDYVHTVSAGYLLRKVEASFPALGGLFRAARRVVPARLPVPVSLGDNMVIVAERL